MSLHATNFVSKASCPYSCATFIAITKFDCAQSTLQREQEANQWRLSPNLDCLKGDFTEGREARFGTRYT